MANTNQHICLRKMLTIMSGWVELRNRNNDRNFTLLLRGWKPTNTIQYYILYKKKRKKNLKIKMTIDK